MPGSWKNATNAAVAFVHLLELSIEPDLSNMMIMFTGTSVASWLASAHAASGSIVAPSPEEPSLPPPTPESIGTPPPAPVPPPAPPWPPAVVPSRELASLPPHCDVPSANPITACHQGNTPDAYPSGQHPLPEPLRLFEDISHVGKYCANSRRKRPCVRSQLDAC